MKWRGVRTNRHVVVVYATGLERAAFSELHRTCARQGWRPVKARVHSERQVHQRASSYSYCSGKCTKDDFDEGNCECQPPEPRSVPSPPHIFPASHNKYEVKKTKSPRTGPHKHNCSPMILLGQTRPPTSKRFSRTHNQTNQSPGNQCVRE